MSLLLARGGQNRLRFRYLAAPLVALGLVWTGTNDNGTTSNGGGYANYGLGGSPSNNTITGSTDQSGSLWVNCCVVGTTQSLPIFAISTETFYAPPAPEPASVVLMLAPLAGLAVAARRKRRSAL